MDWTQRLKVRQLHLLVDLFETGNLSKTAARLGATQPGMSKFLGDLEDDLQVKLFERNSRGLTPTPFCVALVAHAKVILGELARTQSTIRLMSDGATGTLVIGMTPTAATGVVPTAAAYFRRKFPDAYVEIIEGRLDDLLPQLREGKLDGIVALTDQTRFDGSLRCDILFQEQMRLVVCKTHPLARKRKVTWADVQEYPWISPAHGSPLRKELDHELAMANQAAPKFRVQTGSTVTIVTLLQESDLVSPMSVRVARYFQGLGLVVPLPIPTTRDWSVGLIRRRNVPLTPLMRAFMEGLKLTN